MTMPTIFDVKPQPEESEEPEFCDYCGAECYEDGSCMNALCGTYEGMREPSDDFPMYLEYEGAYGLSGYDSFYDYSDLGSEY